MTARERMRRDGWRERSRGMFFRTVSGRECVVVGSWFTMAAVNRDPPRECVGVGLGIRDLSQRAKSAARRLAK